MTIAWLALVDDPQQPSHVRRRKPLRARRRHHPRRSGGVAEAARACREAARDGGAHPRAAGRRAARSGEWHTKLFQEERERSLLLLVDTHPEMRFGTRVRYKSVAAARAAALAAWTGVRGGDRVGALAFGDVRDAVDPHGGVRGALAVLGALARWDARAASAATAERLRETLSAALERARRLALPGSRLLLLSDGWCTDEAAQRALLRLTRHIDVRVLIVVDALEHELPPAGAYAFRTDAGRMTVDLSAAAARARFRDDLARGQRMLAGACDGACVRWALLDTGQEPDAVLAQLWKQRGGRR